MSPRDFKALQVGEFVSAPSHSFIVDTVTKGFTVLRNLEGGDCYTVPRGTQGLTPLDCAFVNCLTEVRPLPPSAAHGAEDK